MPRNGGVHENYFACALLLSLMECWFFYADADRAIDGSVRRWLNVMNKGILTGTEETAEKFGVSGAPREDSSDPERIQDALAEDLNDPLYQDARKHIRSLAEPMPLFSKTNPSYKPMMGRAQSSVMPIPDGNWSRPIAQTGASSSYASSVMRDAIGSTAGTLTPASRRQAADPSPWPSGRSAVFPKNRIRKGAASSQPHLWRPVLDKEEWGKKRRQGKNDWLNSAHLPFSKEFNAFKRRRTGRKEDLIKRSQFPISHASLKQLLGSGALNPPQGRLEPPDFYRYQKQRFILPNGQPLRLSPVTAQEAELLKPPDTALDREEGRSAGPHWHGRSLHTGPLWMLPSGDHWVPLLKDAHHWWTQAEEQQPLVWSQGHWWWKEDGVWFVLHGGQPWAYRWFSGWEQAGLLNPQTDTRIVYSADELKAAVITPGADTVLFDLRTGGEIQRWSYRPRKFRAP